MLFRGQDFDGGFLSSLSIEDSTMYLSAPDGDTMEVDTTEYNTASAEQDFDRASSSTPESYPFNIPQSTPISKEKDEELDEEEVEDEDESNDTITDQGNTSIVSSISNAILSPTTLGAKLASKKPLYLPAPSWYSPSESETSKENDIDHEYDLSSFGNVTTTDVDPFHKRNMNSFSPRPRNIFLNEDNESVLRPRKNDSYNSPNDLMGQFYQQWMQRTPIQIHHHHYYQSSPTVMQTPRDIQKNFYSSQYLSPLKPVSQHTELTEPMDYSLPLPWEASSTPNEKIPYMLSSYLQLIVNFVVSGYAFYLLTSIISAIRKDINHKIYQHSTNVLAEIASCERSYIENNCSPDDIVPALEKLCTKWLKCMNQDPLNGNTSLVSAETLGMIMNSLVEPLGIKFFLIVFGFILLIFTCNLTFGFIRARTYYGNDPPEIEMKD